MGRATYMLHALPCALTWRSRKLLDLREDSHKWLVLGCPAVVKRGSKRRFQQGKPIIKTDLVLLTVPL